MSWTITNPAGAGTVTLASLNLADPEIELRVMGVSTARMTALRELGSADAWWPHDAEITLYLDAAPQFTGRVQEAPDAASGRSSTRDLFLADAWQDISSEIYQEEWGVGVGAHLFPRAVLGLDEAGVQITTGAQIGAVIDYLITRGVNIAKGTIAEGYGLWPSEVRNVTCDSIIVGEMRFHPDWVAWLDHTSVPPVFHARAKADLDAVTIDLLTDRVESRRWAEVKRNVPLGVEITYQSAAIIDGEPYRSYYIDAAGVTTGRRVSRAMLDLEGMQMQRQKTRIRTRDIPAEGDAEEVVAAQKEFLIANIPQLGELDPALWTIKNFRTALVVDAAAHPPAISEKAPRLVPSDKSEIPRQLVNGQPEDWMRKKTGKITVTYDLEPVERNWAIQPRIAALEGKDLAFTITATNATTRRYVGVSSFTEGEGRPEGIAAALFAAATEQQFEGSITTAHDQIPPGRWHGKKLIIKKGLETIIPGAVVTTANISPQAGRITMSFGSMPHLSAGDLLDLQRLFNRRQPTWMSPEERTSNKYGAEESASAAGDSVGGYDQPQTTAAPCGGGGGPVPFDVRLQTESSSHTVTVGWGYVSERIPGAGNATPPPWEPANMRSEEDAALLRKHAITVGQAVYVAVEVDENGKITAPAEGEAVSILIDADNKTSTHYRPKVDDLTSAGAVGTMYYKLAVLRAAVSPATTPTLEPWLCGSHIDHYAELPAMLSTLAPGTNIGVIPQKFDNDAKAYKFRALQALCGMKITQTEDRIQIRPDGNNFRLRLWRPTLSVNLWTYAVIVTQPSTPEKEFWVMNGVWYTTEPPNWGDCGTSGAPVYDVSYLAPTGGGGS